MKTLKIEDIQLSIIYWKQKQEQRRILYVVLIKMFHAHRTVQIPLIQSTYRICRK